MIAPPANGPNASGPNAIGMEPGMRVRHPVRPEWGVGQVQSVVGPRVTVNFEHAGKVLINAASVALAHADD